MTGKRTAAGKLLDVQFSRTHKAGCSWGLVSASPLANT
jgi:hypothetical protein